MMRLAQPNAEDIHALIHRTLDQLPEESRVPLILHFLLGRCQQEIAAELAMSQRIVSGRLKNGLEELVNKLGEASVDVSATRLAALLKEDAAIAVPPSLAVSLRKIGLAGVRGEFWRRHGRGDQASPAPTRPPSTRSA